MEVLEKRDEINHSLEENLNKEITEKLSLDWEKKNMPMALLELFELEKRLLK